MAYYRHNDGTLENLNMMTISDSKVHNPVSVHAFLEAALDLLKTKFPTVKKYIISLTAAAASIRTDTTSSTLVPIKVILDCRRSGIFSLRHMERARAMVWEEQ